MTLAGHADRAALAPAAAGWLLDFGDAPQPYAEVWALQRDLVRARQQGAIPDVLLLLEHRPVVTLGRSADRAHVLAPPGALAARGIELFEVERGGSATYHGPGQLVGYPIVDLRRLGEDVGRFMRTLEATIIEVLAGFGVPAGRRLGYPGVWVGDAKICAMGVAVKRRVTMHGFALNVTTDLDAFTVINPCGLGLPVTSMARVLGREVPMAEVRRAYARRFAAAFGLELAPAGAQALRAALAG
ncbi:MAG: lipoyl(octanoyl) transferase LipB [Armatimonadota bacterium]|nr:lipoyl(octanoyl) transferase LipB [Armatimonadota bacterium]MDR7421831.1 lipoyl(octanoyl) transferase LipB [Armatimonadota bacterium]MDR7455424.1 lipoyl(octanoyl) transferase LipB [Armatimonadota bacterium]MDR7457014.1 lipoyl(octanoyl) transferase LipB [Armatimonadota bacterium]MDR7497533.1 lipoyl(octanoyl) transferase LipB [Armatimonadota bacterium]